MVKDLIKKYLIHQNMQNIQKEKMIQVNIVEKLKKVIKRKISAENTKKVDIISQNISQKLNLLIKKVQ